MLYASNLYYFCLQINTITTTRSLSIAILDGCRRMIGMRESVHRLMKKCENLSNEMQYSSTLDGKIDSGMNGNIVKQPDSIPSQ